MKFISRLLSPYFCHKRNIDQLAPFRRDFGFSRGKPVDRFYIDSFIEKNKKEIRGCILEFGEVAYSLVGDRSVKSEIFCANCNELREAESIPLDLTSNHLCKQYKGKFDCIIATQVLNFIFDYKSALNNIERMLKPGGVALITVAGLVQVSEYDDQRWGDYWRFNKKTVARIVDKIFSDVDIDAYGNYASTVALLSGACVEDIGKEALMQVDDSYQVVVSVLARK